MSTPIPNADVFVANDRFVRTKTNESGIAKATVYGDEAAVYAHAPNHIMKGVFVPLPYAGAVDVFLQKPKVLEKYIDSKEYGVEPGFADRDTDGKIKAFVAGRWKDRYLCLIDLENASIEKCVKSDAPLYRNGIFGNKYIVTWTYMNEENGLIRDKIAIIKKDTFQTYMHLEIAGSVGGAIFLDDDTLAILMVADGVRIRVYNLETKEIIREIGINVYGFEGAAMFRIGDYIYVAYGTSEALFVDKYSYPDLSLVDSHYLYLSINRILGIYTNGRYIYIAYEVPETKYWYTAVFDTVDFVFKRTNANFIGHKVAKYANTDYVKAVTIHYDAIYITIYDALMNNEIASERFGTIDGDLVIDYIGTNVYYFGTNTAIELFTEFILEYIYDGDFTYHSLNIYMPSPRTIVAIDKQNHKLTVVSDWTFKYIIIRQIDEPQPFNIYEFKYGIEIMIGYAMHIDENGYLETIILDLETNQYFIGKIDLATLDTKKLFDASPELISTLMNYFFTYEITLTNNNYLIATVPTRNDVYAIIVYNCETKTIEKIMNLEGYEIPIHITKGGLLLSWIYTYIGLTLRIRNIFTGEIYTSDLLEEIISTSSKIFYSYVYDAPTNIIIIAGENRKYGIHVIDKETGETIYKNIVETEGIIWLSFDTPKMAFSNILIVPVIEETGSVATIKITTIDLIGLTMNVIGEINTGVSSEEIDECDIYSYFGNVIGIYCNQEYEAFLIINKLKNCIVGSLMAALAPSPPPGGGGGTIG